jgi:hypothetical protein
MIRRAFGSAVSLAVFFLSLPLLAQAPGTVEEPPTVPPPADPPPPVMSAGQPAPVREPMPLAPSPFPSDGFGRFPDPAMMGLGGPAVLRGDYRLTWMPDASVSGQNTKLASWRNDLSAFFPFWQDGPDAVSGSVRVRGEFFHTDAVLPDTGRPFPDELWNINFGANYRHLFDNGWVGGVGVSVGSASDKPFHGIDEMTLGVHTFLRIPSGEHNAWLFSLAYSPTSELHIPIPGVAYIWQPSEQFRMNIGLPFQLWYRPIDDLTLDFSYMLLRTVHAKATYRLLPDVFVHGGFDWSNESFFLADREDRNDRFFSYDKRLSGGVLFRLTPKASLDLSGGYVFDRFYFEGQNYSDRNRDRIDVGNGPFVSGQFLLRW